MTLLSQTETRTFILHLLAHLLTRYLYEHKRNTIFGFVLSIVGFVCSGAGCWESV